MFKMPIQFITLVETHPKSQILVLYQYPRISGNPGLSNLWLYHFHLASFLAQQFGGGILPQTSKEPTPTKTAAVLVLISPGCFNFIYLPSRVHSPIFTRRETEREGINDGLVISYNNFYYLSKTKKNVLKTE